MRDHMRRLPACGGYVPSSFYGYGHCALPRPPFRPHLAGEREQRPATVADVIRASRKECQEGGRWED